MRKIGFSFSNCTARLRYFKTSKFVGNNWKRHRPKINKVSGFSGYVLSNLIAWLSASSYLPV